MPRPSPNAPDQFETLDNILPETLKTAANRWQSKFGRLTRGDFMRLRGFAPIQNPNDKQDDWRPVPGLGPYNIPTDGSTGRGCLSGVLPGLTGQDIWDLSKILEQYNQMSYGNTVYVCCTCV